MTLIYGGYSWISTAIIGVDDGYFFIEPPFSFWPHFLCKVTWYVYRVTSCASSYMIVLFSFERCVGVWFPLQLHGWVTNSRRKKVIILTFFVVFLISTPILVISKVTLYDGMLTCFAPSGDLLVYIVIEMIDNIIPVALPCLLIATSSVIIICGVRISKNE